MRLVTNLNVRIREREIVCIYKGMKVDIRYKRAKTVK
jgi:hypothetical protein